MHGFTRLLLIRHGESIGNRWGIMQGPGGSRLGSQAGAQGKYDRLTPQGWHQALALGHHLARSQTPPPTHLYTSPAHRTQQTLAALCWSYDATQQGDSWPTIVRQGHEAFPMTSQEDEPAIQEPAVQEPGVQGFAVPGVTVQGLRLDLALSSRAVARDDRLQEIDNGIFCGLTWSQAQAHYPELCQRLLQSADWVPIPEAETPRQCRDRSVSWAETLHGLPPGSQIWALTHGGILPYLVAAILGSDRTWGFQAHPTAYFELLWDGDRWRSSQSARSTPLARPTPPPLPDPGGHPVAPPDLSSDLAPGSPAAPKAAPNCTAHSAAHSAPHPVSDPAAHMLHNTTLWQIRHFNHCPHYHWLTSSQS
ncbi:MAG: histidine phosphatase family protein [Prochlorothrix sp.]